jgi:hypothetical protein
LPAPGAAAQRPGELARTSASARWPHLPTPFPCCHPPPRQVIPICIKAAFLSCGQNCAGGERFLIHSSIYNK